MDRVLIDTYRGVEIYFDIDDEKFFAAIDDQHFAAKRQSFAAAKKAIDDFVKGTANYTLACLHCLSAPESQTLHHL